MLSTTDRRIAQEFKQRLLSVVIPLDLRVFGSRARGDAAQDSDLDIYIEVEELSPAQRMQISDVAWAVGYDTDRVISTFVVTRDQLEHGSIGASPIVDHVMAEGLPI